jgi:multidrug efflux system membrane fusion protein
MDEPRPLTPALPDEPVVPTKRRWWGSLVAILCLALLGGLAWYLTHRPAAPAAGGFGGGGGPGGGARGGRGGAGASTVGIATAKRADIPVLIDALGTVTPLENVTVQVQVSGVLTQVLFKEGQTVKKGDVLATIDPRPFQIALDQATGARIRDEAQLDAARVTAKRYQVLLTQDSIARQDVDTQVALVKQLEGTVTMDRAAENTARLNLGYTRIVAPIAGRVGLRPVDAGNYVSTGTTTGIAVLTRVTPMDVVFSIPQDRIPELQARIAAGAQLPVAAYDRTRTRKLDDGMFLTLDNAVDTATGTVKAKARYSNASGNLFPNQFVNAELLVRTIQGAVVVPVTALRYGPNGDFVYVVKDGNTVELRNVTRGDASVDLVAINTGLQVGEVVVTEGGDRLKEGARVQTAVERPAGSASDSASGARGGRGARGARGAYGGHGASGGAPGGSEAIGAAGTPPSAPAAAHAAGPAASGPPVPLPTPEQRQRMLDAAKDDPEQLARRKQFLEALDRGDPTALQRWQQLVNRRREGGGTTQ